MYINYWRVNYTYRIGHMQKNFEAKMSEKLVKNLSKIE